MIIKHDNIHCFLSLSKPIVSRFQESLSISGRGVVLRTVLYDWRRTVIFSEFVGILHNRFQGRSCGDKKCYSSYGLEWMFATARKIEVSVI